jgi:DNA-directed RNA polymerase subunit M/transcription elongation factor TFIIS
MKMSIDFCPQCGKTLTAAKGEGVGVATCAGQAGACGSLWRVETVLHYAGPAKPGKP